MFLRLLLYGFEDQYIPGNTIPSNTFWWTSCGTFNDDPEVINVFPNISKHLSMKE